MKSPQQCIQVRFFLGEFFLHQKNVLTSLAADLDPGLGNLVVVEPESGATLVTLNDHSELRL
jgi:hypothetical protein